MPQPEPLSEATPISSELRLRSASFVVRVWTQAAVQRGCSAPTWRGQIVHVQSGATTHFTREAGILAFIEEQLKTDGGAQ